MLLQGALLFLLSIGFFIQIGMPLVDFQNLSGIVALLNGAIFILGYFFSNPFDKSLAELILGIFLLGGSLFFLFTNPMDQNGVAWFLAGYMLVNGFFYASLYWRFRSVMRFWWVAALLPAYTMFVVLFIQKGISNTTLSTQALAGLQFLFCSMSVLVMAFVARRLENEFKKPISHFQ
jgi:uncharacterized membrane protein HdeD (DUF308 family)